MNLKQVFEKQGGVNLIKQYLQNGSFFTAVSQFLLLGRSRTALEILRLSVNLRVKQKLEKKYRSELEKFDQNWIDNNIDQSLEHRKSKKVWVCWFQGLEDAPNIVKKCYNSLKINMPDKDITLITEDNMMEYVKFPQYILDKWKNGNITHTHMTDLLRLELLINYGGMWVDATVYCSDSNIPNYIFDSELFFFQCLKPGRDGHSSYISSWLISAKSNNKLLMACRDLCYKYWEQNEKMVDYFLLHDFMAIVLDYYEEDWKRVVPRDNATPHILLLRLFDQYDESVWNAVRNQSCFHKMTYKFSEEQTKIKGTYYDRLFN